MNPSRTAGRRASIVGGAVLAASLLAGCASTPPPPPDAEVVPTALPSKPTIKPQPRPKLEVTPPRYLIYGAGRASAEEVWQQSLDYVSDWLLNPTYMKQHHVTSVKELDGLTRIMTQEAGARWRKLTHKALRGYVHPYPSWWQKKTTLELPVNQLVTFSLLIRSDRGWDNPMMSPLEIQQGAVITAGDAIGVIMPISTRLRFIGQGKRYTVNSRSAVGLTWRQEGGVWKIDSWWRVYRLDPEKLKGWRPGQAPPADTEPNGGTPPDDGSGPSADPTLVPD